MSFWVQFAVMIGGMVIILGFFFTIYWIYTKKMWEEEDRATRELLEKWDRDKAKP